MIGVSRFLCTLIKPLNLMLLNHCLLIQSLLWQRKFQMIRYVIECEHLNDSQLYQLVSGSHLLARRKELASVDRKLSA